MNQAIHQVDLLLWMMGDVSHIMGFTTMLAHERIEVEDTAAACLRFQNGALGVIQATTSVWPGYPKTIAIHGDRGLRRHRTGRPVAAGISSLPMPTTTHRSASRFAQQDRDALGRVEQSRHSATSRTSATPVPRLADFVQAIHARAGAA